MQILSHHLVRANHIVTQYETSIRKTKISLELSRMSGCRAYQASMSKNVDVSATDGANVCVRNPWSPSSSSFFIWTPGSSAPNTNIIVCVATLYCVPHPHIPSGAIRTSMVAFDMEMFSRCFQSPRKINAW